MKSGNREAQPARNGQKRVVDLGASQDQPLSQKRSRVSRACDQCRASREKCDGTQPFCHTCLSQRRKCTYKDQPKKRGIQPNYIRTLELIIAWLFRASPGIDTRLATHIATLEDAVHRTISAKDGNSAEGLHQEWRNSIISRQIDQMLSGAPIESPVASGIEQAHGSSPRSALSDHTNAQGDNSLAVEPGDRHAAQDLHTGRPIGSYSAIATENSLLFRRSDPDLGRHRPSEPQQSSNLQIRAVKDTSQNLKLPEDTWALIEYYFAFTHAWMPITEKKDILKLIYTYPAAGLSRASVFDGYPSYCELWTILALSAAQLETTGQSRHHANSADLREVTKALLSLDIRALNLSHLRAMLLHVIMEIMSENWQGAWFLIGRAIRLLLSLETDASNPDDDPDKDIPDLKPVKLSCFVLEVAIASYLGVPSVHLRPENVEETGLLNEDGSEEWSPWHDPLATSSSKSPAMSLSTTNRLVRMGLRLFDKDGFLHLSGSGSAAAVARRLPTDLSFTRDRQEFPSDVPINSTPSHNALTDAPSAFGRAQRSTDTGIRFASLLQKIVTALVSNAMQPHGRLQPVKVVASHESDAPPGSAATDLAANQLKPQPHLGLLNLPSKTGDSALSNSQDLGAAHEERNAWHLDPQPSNVLPANLKPGTSGTAVSGAEVFEELALLEHIDSRQHPQFMQNLGFAPDLDLAEFFGADYQPSDPLLTYIQSSNLNEPSGSTQYRTNPG